jgi:amino acid adenylation domain-containing protein
MEGPKGNEHYRAEDLSGSLLERQIDYWRRHLEGVKFELELPVDRSRAAVQSGRIERVRVVLNTEVTAKLRALAQRHDTATFVVLYAGWAILLSRLSGQDDVLIGTPVAGRQRTEPQELIGVVANALALRINTSGDLTVKEFLKHAKNVKLEAYDHQEVPFQKIVKALHPRPDPSRHPVFQAMFTLQPASIEESHFQDFTVPMPEGVNGQSPLDLSLSLREHSYEILGSLNYARDLFDAETIERWVACLTVLLMGLADANHDCRLSDLLMLPERERYQVIELFNDTQASYPHDRLIHELFENQVEQTPDAIAVFNEGQPLTYAVLNGKANQLARYLRGQGLQRGDYIPILMPRCVQMLIAQLAVLKCGGVYVPVDPAQPIERQAFMIQDCGARLLLSTGAAPVELELGSLRWIDCNALAGSVAELPRDDLLLGMETPSSPAYLMYTSGSTGTPKGVIIPHRAVNRLAINGGYAQIERSDRIAYCSNPAFDASTFETWGALLNGASVVIVPQCILLDPARFADVLVEHDVTILCLTTAFFNQLANTSPEIFARLRYLLVGGEAADVRATRRVLRKGVAGDLLNMYGPTETTTYATWYPTSSLGPEATSVPIGQPISNTQVYILDRYLRPVPIGVVGEIYIGGPGVALGYLNRPELTSERFIADPFSVDQGPRMYKTGDLGRWRPGGIVEYCGRNDHQVKIRGFRIELGEIEARLAEDAQVKQAIVLAREDRAGEKRLVAYVVPQSSPSTEAVLDIERLRAHLKSTLPDYMVPRAFVAITHMPLTRNGKLDRQALPVPGHQAYLTEEYEAPQGEAEQTLAAIWRELLSVDRVGRHDDFFQLGGNSLHGMTLIRKVTDRFKVQLSTVAVFKSPTVREMAEIIEELSLGDQPLPLGADTEEFEEGSL